MRPRASSAIRRRPSPCCATSAWSRPPSAAPRRRPTIPRSWPPRPRRFPRPSSLPRSRAARRRLPTAAARRLPCTPDKEIAAPARERLPFVSCKESAMDHGFRRAAWLLCLAAGSAAAQPASPNPDTQALRREIEAMRAEYEARLQALEQRLKAAEAAAATPAPAAQAAPAPAPVAAAPAPATGAAPGGGFQPAVSLILSGGYFNSSKDPATYRIRGFSLPPDAEIGPGVRGFSLAESEL